MEPTFRSNRVEFTVKLPNLNYKTSEGGALNDTLNGALNDEEKMVLEIFRSNPQITLTALSELVPFSKRTLQRITKKMTEEGYLERVGSKKTGSWIVKY